jgi:protein SCO1/2
MESKRSTVLAAIAAALGAAASPAPTVAGELWGPDYFPNVELQTQDGRTVRFYDDLLKDRLVAIDLIYTRCRFSCPLETARLAQVQRILGDRVGKDVFFYSITLDPEHDTPAVLKAYAEKYRAGPGWLFLTGRKEDVKLVAHKLGLLSRGETPVNRDGHTPELMVGNVPAGQWMRNSAVDDPRFLATIIGGMLDGWRSRRPARSYSEASALTLSKGEYLFSTRCSACHTVGKGDGVGPDLLGVTKVRERGWLSRFIAMPDQVLAERDPIALALHARYEQVNMPNLRLGPEDVAALVEYLDRRTAALEGQGSAAVEPPDGAAAAPGAGDRIPGP